VKIRHRRHIKLPSCGFGLCSEGKETLNKTPMKKQAFLWQNNPYFTCFWRGRKEYIIKHPAETS